MPAVIDWTAESLPCGQIRVDAHADRPRAPISVRVDGVEVARGRGAVHWTGDAFAGQETASVQAGEDPPRTLVGDVDARASLVVSQVPPTETAIPSAYPTRNLPIGVLLETRCPLADFRWTVTTHGPSASTTRNGGFDGSRADASREVPLWTYDASLALTWRGRVVDTDKEDTKVLPVCIDHDDDGLCGQRKNGDCNDANPLVRPGLPDVLGDGLDNDCDGAIAGDLDGDGFEPPTDCDDADRDVNPDAEEPGDGVDRNCDGTIQVFEGPWAAPGREPYAVPSDDVTARDVARVTPSGTLEVRDRAKVWSTSPLTVPDLLGFTADPPTGQHLLTYAIFKEIRRIRTGTGGGAWLVVLEESDAWATKQYTVRWGWVLVATGASGLAVTRLDLGTKATAMGVGTSTLVLPEVTSDGFTAGRARFRWNGDRLERASP